MHNNIFIKITEYSLQSLLIMMYHVIENIFWYYYLIITMKQVV